MCSSLPEEVPGTLLHLDQDVREGEDGGQDVNDEVAGQDAEALAKLVPG